jgi:hypothetical protein
MRLKALKAYRPPVARYPIWVSGNSSPSCQTDRWRFQSGSVVRKTDFRFRAGMADVGMA